MLINDISDYNGKIINGDFIDIDKKALNAKSLEKPLQS